MAASLRAKRRPVRVRAEGDSVGAVFARAFAMKALEIGSFSESSAITESASVSDLTLRVVFDVAQ